MSDKPVIKRADDAIRKQTNLYLSPTNFSRVSLQKIPDSQIKNDLENKILNGFTKFLNELRSYLSEANEMFPKEFKNEEILKSIIRTQHEVNQSRFSYKLFPISAEYESNLPGLFPVAKHEMCGDFHQSTLHFGSAFKGSLLDVGQQVSLKSAFNMLNMLTFSYYTLIFQFKSNIANVFQSLVDASSAGSLLAPAQVALLRIFGDSADWSKYNQNSHGIEMAALMLIVGYYDQVTRKKDEHHETMASFLSYIPNLERSRSISKVYGVPRWKPTDTFAFDNYTGVLGRIAASYAMLITKNCGDETAEGYFIPATFILVKPYLQKSETAQRYPTSKTFYSTTDVERVLTIKCFTLLYLAAGGITQRVKGDSLNIDHITFFLQSAVETFRISEIDKLVNAFTDPQSTEYSSVIGDYFNSSLTIGSAKMMKLHQEILQHILVIAPFIHRMVVIAQEPDEKNTNALAPLSMITKDGALYILSQLDNQRIADLELTKAQIRQSGPFGVLDTYINKDTNTEIEL